VTIRRDFQNVGMNFAAGQAYVTVHLLV